MRLQPYVVDSVHGYSAWEITDDDRIVRRIDGSEHSRHIVVDEKTPQGKRLSSIVFKPSSAARGGGMSVDLLEMINFHEPDATAYLIKPPWVGALEFKAADLRGLGFEIAHDAVANKPYHALVCGQFSRRQITDLSKTAKWFVEIRNVSITGC